IRYQGPVDLSRGFFSGIRTRCNTAWPPPPARGALPPAGALHHTTAADTPATALGRRAQARLQNEKSAAEPRGRLEPRLRSNARRAAVSARQAPTSLQYRQSAGTLRGLRRALDVLRQLVEVEVAVNVGGERVERVGVL